MELTNCTIGNCRPARKSMILHRLILNTSGDWEIIGLTDKRRETVQNNPEYLKDWIQNRVTNVFV